MAAAIKMDELLVSWLSRDDVYDSVMEWIESYSAAEAQKHQQQQQQQMIANTGSGGMDLLQKRLNRLAIVESNNEDDTFSKTATTMDSVTGSEYDESTIPPFYPVGQQYPCRRIVRSTSSTSTSSLGSQQSDQQQEKPSTVPSVTSTKADIKNSKKNAVSTALLVAQFETWEPIGEPDIQTDRTLLTKASVNSGTSKAALHNGSTGTFDDITGERAFGGTTTIVGLLENNSSTVGSVDEENTDGLVVRLGSQSYQQQHLLSPSAQHLCARDCALAIYEETCGRVSSDDRLTVDQFTRITKEVCRFPSYFNVPLYTRIIEQWKMEKQLPESVIVDGVSIDMLEWYFRCEMEPYDAYDRFFRLVRSPGTNYIVRDDFLPFIKALLSDHPGLEFLSSHAEFQEKYAVTVITRIFYSVNRCNSGRITARQVRRSDLLHAFIQVDEEEDINKVTRYFSYEHFYVLYCRFWELDHDRDYRITREDLLKYGDHSLSHMIVDRIFDAAPRPFEQQKQQQHSSQLPNAPTPKNDTAATTAVTVKNANSREYLSYEDFIYFMLSEEDKSNEVAVRYWFACVDVDGDNKLNNMEMRSFYAVQLHRMQCMGHEIVPFDDMLCQMMDMIKPATTEYLVVEDFLKMECSQVSGAVFDALFNLNKYLLFEQRDPFVERQKREDEFECDWDRFACIDYNRLAMEEEAREEEAMEIDWVTVDDEDDDDNSTSNTATTSASVSGAGTVIANQEQFTAAVASMDMESDATFRTTRA